MKIKILTLATDTKTGTTSEVFTDQAKLHDRQRKIIEETIPTDGNYSDYPYPDHIQTIIDLLKAGDVAEAWHMWADCDNGLRDPLDTYSIDEHEIEVNGVPVVDARPPQGQNGKQPLPFMRSGDGMFIIAKEIDGQGISGAGAFFDWYNDRLQICVMETDKDEPALHVRYKHDGSIAEIIVRDDLSSVVKWKAGNTLWQQERDGVRPAADMAVRLSQTCPDFQCAIGKIATVAGKTPLEVFALWRKYVDAAPDQSAMVGEFIEHYAKDLGGDQFALREAVYGKEVA